MNKKRIRAKLFYFKEFEKQDILSDYIFGTLVFMFKNKKLGTLKNIEYKKYINTDSKKLKIQIKNYLLDLYSQTANKVLISFRENKFKKYKEFTYDSPEQLYDSFSFEPKELNLSLLVKTDLAIFADIKKYNKEFVLKEKENYLKIYSNKYLSTLFNKRVDCLNLLINGLNGKSFSERKKMMSFLFKDQFWQD